MSVGTAFHPRTSPLNRKMQWREWSGYFASSVYADAHDIEYNAIRKAAALIDVSPLYKYLVVGAGCPPPGRPGDHPRRDEARGRRRHLHALVRRARQGRRRRHHPPARRRRYRWTAADPQLRWLRQNSAGLDVTITEESETTAALALQGPLSRDVLEAATGESFADLRYFRRRAVEDRQGRHRRVADRLHRRSRLRAVDPGTERGQGLGRADRRRARLRHPAGRDAGARRRAPRGRADPDRGRLHLLAPRDEPAAELLARRDRARAPGQLRQGRLRRAGSRSSARRKAGGPARRLVGLQLDWYDIEGLYDAQGLPPAISPSVDRSPVPVFAAGRQVGRATSHGWSPILKQAIALASVGAAYEALGTRLGVEWTVEGRREPGRRDRRRAAVPRPGAQARLTDTSPQGDGGPVVTARDPGPAQHHRTMPHSTARHPHGTPVAGAA